MVSLSIKKLLLQRQVSIGIYIVDFACLEKHLIIELDGGQHMDNQTYDTKRTTWLNEYGFKVLRFWNHDILQKISSVIEVILKVLSNSRDVEDHISGSAQL